jgi:phosphoribosylanthranilate isomerase
MALQTNVKISSVTNLSDARYCAGMGVKFMGFSIDPEDPKYISTNTFKEITSWVAGVQYVGEYHRTDSADIIKMHHDYGFDLMELDIHFPDLKGLAAEIPVIARISSSDFLARDGLKRLLDDFGEVDRFIFEDDRFNVPQEILELSSIYKIIIGTGVGEGNVSELIRKYHIHGIALKGGEEISPGYKDFDELADILEKIEMDDE